MSQKNLKLNMSKTHVMIIPPQSSAVFVFVFFLTFSISENDTTTHSISQVKNLIPFDINFFFSPTIKSITKPSWLYLLKSG